MGVGFWITSFFLILLALVLINAKVNGGFKIESSWIAVALSPAIIWLIATGQLAEFSGFGLAFKLKEASAKPFSLNLDGDRIEPVSLSLGEKNELGMIPALVQRRVSALSLQLNRKGYYSSWAIDQYLEQLTAHEFFRYCVFLGNDGSFRGIVSARDLLSRLRQEDLDLVRVIEEGAIDRIPGIQTVAVSITTSKRDALKLMDDQNTSQLPVVDESGQFVGMVDRDKIASSILLQLIAQP